MQLSISLLVFFSVSLAETVLGNRQKYAGNAVWEVRLDHHEHIGVLKSIQDLGVKMDFWREIKRLPGTADIMISSEDQQVMKNFLESHKIPYSVKVEDVENLLEKEFEQIGERVVFEEGDHPLNFTIDEWHNYTEIINYVNAVAEHYSSFVSKFTIGKSYEGREQTGLKIGNPTSNNKPAVYIEGTIHAREWLGTNTMLYIIDQLTNNASAYKQLLDAIDVYVLPVTNPDGYAYTWTPNGRMWRKTRSGPRNGCYGVDPNRNWEFKWGVSGSSKDPCEEDYAGPSPASEIEVQNLQKFLGEHKDTIKSVFDVHACLGLFMYPYGYADVIPPDADKLATGAIYAVNGVKFQYGPIYEVIYPASGSSVDYTRGVLNIDYSYAMELRCGNKGDGFIIPKDQIIPGAAEAWAGIQVIWEQVAKEHSNL